MRVLLFASGLIYLLMCGLTLSRTKQGAAADSCSTLRAKRKAQPLSRETAPKKAGEVVCWVACRRLKGFGAGMRCKTERRRAVSHLRLGRRGATLPNVRLRRDIIYLSRGR